MKRLLYLVMCIAVLVNLVSCSNVPERAAVKSPVYPRSISFEDYKSRRSVREENPIDGSYIESLNSFSYKTISRILSGQSRNSSYSPVSLYMALSLAATGANGATQDEIFSVLGVSGKGTDFLSVNNCNFFKLLYADNEIGKLKIANSLWLQKDTAFKDAFVTNAVENFYASVYSVDFSNESTAQLMGKWVSENTNGILSPRISLDHEQIMSIINTIYFKDEWVDRFNKENTKPDIFHLEDGSEIKCDFMNMKYTVHRFLKGDGFTSSSLSLKDSGSMMFILPDKGVSIDELLSTPEKAAVLFDEDNRVSGKEIFQIPKFSFRSDLDLDDKLKAKRVTSVFKSDADFSGITDDITFISSVRQQTHIAIDEKGVEAAAFTQFNYVGSEPPNEKVAEMILNRPFVFAVKSRQGAILFAGVVNNPTDYGESKLK